MAFRKPRKAPQFADLKSVLAQSKDTDNSLYQVIQEIIDRLSQFQFDVSAALAETIGSGVVGPHATTHSESNTDPVDVKNLAGYPGNPALFLRGDKTFGPTPAVGGMNLDYLGNYVPGTYVDGDIVVAADGIAYMCVVDGTVTPPEPWPGVGISVNPIVDATYWTVSSHPTLVNERALNLLANGYVKSTAGIPSTIAVIPVAEGGTGASDSTQARANLGVGSAGTINLNGDANAFLSGTGAWAYTPAIPVGMIAIFATACPPGWGRVSVFDGLFLRGGPTHTGAVGGSATHSHTATGLTMPHHNHGGVANGATDTQGDHGHSGTVSGQTNLDNAEHFVGDAGSSGTTTKPHTHNVNIGFNTNNAGSHAHGVSATIPDDGGQSMDGATDAANHLPPFVDVVYCIKQ